MASTQNLSHLQTELITNFILIWSRCNDDDDDDDVDDKMINISRLFCIHVLVCASYLTTHYILRSAVLSMTNWLALRAPAYILSRKAWGLLTVLLWLLTGLLNRVSYVTVGQSSLPLPGVPVACTRCTCSCGLAHSICAWQLLGGATRLLELFIQCVALLIRVTHSSGQHKTFRSIKCCI